MQKKIKQINKLLIKQFGIPPRNKNLPKPIDMILGTILSQNTNDNNSYKAYKNLRAKFSSWEDLLTVSASTIEKEIKVAGLGKQKATAIKNLVDSLYEARGAINLDHVVNMPNLDAINELTQFKGVGVKTASCVLLFALDRDVCPVDTHVHRTVNRIGVVFSNQRDKTFFLLNEKFPTKIAHSFHTNLIRLGREICKSQNPACGACPLKNICEFEKKNLENSSISNERSFMLLDHV